MKTKAIPYYFFFVVILAGCAAPGMGQGYKEKITYEMDGMGKEFNEYYSKVLRPSKAEIEFDMGPYGSKIYSNSKGFIPWSFGAAVADKDYCNRQMDPTCASFFFGDQVLEHPDLLQEFEQWFSNICAQLPSNATRPWKNDRSVAERERSLQRLRIFMSCDSANKSKRKIHLYIVRNFDNLFDSNHLDKNFKTRATIDRSIVKEIIVNIN